MKDHLRLITTPEIAEMPRDAAGWAARLLSDQHTPGDVAAFERWSLEHPEGRADYERMADLTGLLSGAARDPEARAVLRSSRPAQVLGRRSAIAAFVALAASVFAAVITPTLLDRPAVYETRVGETRRVELKDGSVITLNVGSRLRVRMQESERLLWLDHGEARFEVAHDASRPFRVFSDNREVRALGTVFDVRRTDGAFRVVLETGSVGLYPADGSRLRPVAEAGRPVTVLAPGQMAEALADGAGLDVEAADLSVTGAWRDHRLVLDDRPLGEAVAEINRYNARVIVVDDPALAAMRISGVFRTDEPDAFAQAVVMILPARVAARDGEMVKLERLPQG